MNRHHRKKARGAVIVTLALIIYYCVYFAFIISLIGSIVFKIVCAVIPLIFAVLTMHACFERISEINSGEEDDLDKY